MPPSSARSGATRSPGRRAPLGGPAGRVGLELLEARCDHLARDARAAAGGLTFGGAVLLPARPPFPSPRAAPPAP